MQNSGLWVCVGFMAVFTLFSCGISQHDLAQGIKQDFQEKMDADPSYMEYGMKAQKVLLVKSEANSYDGFVPVLLEDETHYVPISVTTDGKAYSWELKPFAFSFLVQYNLRKLDFW